MRVSGPLWRMRARERRADRRPGCQVASGDSPGWAALRDLTAGGRPALGRSGFGARTLPNGVRPGRDRLTGRANAIWRGVQYMSAAEREPCTAPPSLRQLDRSLVIVPHSWPFVCDLALPRRAGSAEPNPD